MNIQTLQQALEDIEKAWRLDYITSDVLPAIQAIRNEIAKHQMHSPTFSDRVKTSTPWSPR